MRGVNVWEVSRGPAEPEGPGPYSVTEVARVVRISVGGPCNGTVRVGKRLREFVWGARVRGILVKRVMIDGVHGVVGTDDGVGHGFRVRRREAEADGVAVQDLVK